jgi:hypothetical protein
MTTPEFLRRQVAIARSRVVKALRFNRRVTGLRAEIPVGAGLPPPEECLQCIEIRTEEYLEALSRYRAAVESVVASAVKQRTRPGSQTGPGRNPARRYSFGEASPGPSKAVLSSRKQRRG